MKSRKRLFLMGLTALLVGACAQQEVYTDPYASVEPQAGAAPLPVTLSLSFTVDGKPDAKRRQEILADLGAAVEASGSFKVVEAATAVGGLKVSVDDNKGSPKSSFLGTLGASVGHVLVSEPEFTPKGRRTARELHVEISFVPTGGTAIDQSYSAKLITVTNNTQDPTDLVSLHDRRHAELALIGNDLNGFAALMAKDRTRTP